MPKWTGFSDKTVWDWLSLLIVPIMLAGATGIFTIFELQREDRRAKQQDVIEQARTVAQQEIESDRTQQAVLQLYIRDMTELLLDNRLSDGGTLVRQIARSNTLTAVRQLDSTRKAILLNFLYGAGLVAIGESPNPIVEMRYVDLSDANLYLATLSGADLSVAYLSGANLSSANLSDAILRDADLSSANLSGADMRGTILSGADLRGANLSGTELGDEVLTDIPDDVIDIQAATRLCQAKTLYQVTGLVGSLLKEVKEQCREKLLEPKG